MRRDITPIHPGAPHRYSYNGFFRTGRNPPTVRTCEPAMREDQPVSTYRNTEPGRVRALHTQHGGHPQIESGSVLLDSFEVIRPLGSGSYATAYLANQRGLDRLAVIKVAHPHLLDGQHGEAIRKRFIVEQRASARVQHPNVVTVYTSGILPDGTPALAMEYVRGESLESMLERSSPLTAQDFYALFQQLASAINALHDVQIAHRDLSPRNIMVHRDEREGRLHVKLLDFGIAQLDDTTHMTSGPLGTPQFMAPEQMHGESTRASDLFALGLLMWWGATGRAFFADCRTPMEIFKVLFEMRAAPKASPELSRWPSPLVRLIEELLSPEPVLRPTAQEVIHAMARFTNSAGESSEWASLSRAQTDQFHTPVKVNVLLFTHPEVDPIAPLENLPADECEIRFRPMHNAEIDFGTVRAHDIFLVPIPLESVGARQITSQLALWAEALPVQPRIIAYRHGELRAQNWMALGASDALSFPDDAGKLRQLTLELLSVKRRSSRSSREYAALDPMSSNVFSFLDEPNTGLGNELSHGLIDTFVGQMPEWILELEDAFDDRARADVLRICGEMSAYAISINAERIGTLCRSICELSTQHYSSAAPSIVQELESEYKALFQTLVTVR